jgi:AbrB family looped-hinge helix DNA binding protein
MKATIDKAGRLVIPKALRDGLGLRRGTVEVRADGSALRVEALASDDLVERDGLLVTAATDYTINDDDVRDLRDADQR